jgi:hypothetical protein
MVDVVDVVEEPLFELSCFSSTFTNIMICYEGRMNKRLGIRMRVWGR